MFIKHLIILIAGVLIFQSCAVKPKGGFQTESLPMAPDYSKTAHWAALPDKVDNADRTPGDSIQNLQNNAPVDVFFLHPTTYTGDKGHREWNGPIDDAKLNEKTDEGTILYQASIFNGVGKVYAPRYRQAHLHSYHTDSRKRDALQAFELAYTDVKAAFEYFLAHYHQGRPIIIAAHSQGTTHAKRLLRDYFDGKPLQQKLVVGYLVGIPVADSWFEALKPCETEEDTGCFCTWRTFKRGHYPKTASWGDSIVVTNPLSWILTDEYVPNALNEGGVLRDFDKIYYNLTDAQIEKGLLWVTKPKFPWSFLYFSPNFHIADFNLFYLNVRNNAIKRAGRYVGEGSR